MEMMPSPRTCVHCRQKQLDFGKRKAKLQRANRNSRLKKSVDYFFKSKRIHHPIFENDRKALTELITQSIAANRYKRRLLSVDHIVPVKHEHVSGLTVSWNLQILLSSENVIKGNDVDLEAEAQHLLKWAKDRGL